ncbi:hypothetical protein MTR66_12160 [Novosphingobium sp. 2638]|uniref:Uncharacterized protein n=2 Tax=Novosphingobium beihaiensis TaxID=2930389 RepID=A0ABT0BR74_9SPHN|nr:hypothetical protein [Novosphingobium beihaiensis]
MISTLGPRMNTVFGSRWKAVWWSAGVLLTAYCSVPSAQQDKAADGGKGQADAAAAVVSAIKGSPSKPEKHVNPWAKKPQG